MFLIKVRVSSVIRYVSDLKLIRLFPVVKCVSFICLLCMGSIRHFIVRGKVGGDAHVCPCV